MTMICCQELVWPTKNPDAVLDYAVDLSSDLQSGETVEQIGVLFRPWGEGELFIAGHSPPVYPNGTQAVVWLSGGLPGRSYLIDVRVSTNEDRVYEYFVTLRIDGALASYPLPDPQNVDLSTMVEYGGNIYDGGVINIAGAGTTVVNTIEAMTEALAVSGAGTFHSSL